MVARRVTREELERLEEDVNRLLDNIKVQVEGRYGYYALDYCLTSNYDPTFKRCRLVDGTLVTGLSKRELAEVLRGLRELLLREKRR